MFRHALLHDGLIRTIMADIGEVAGPDALYWQGGVCGYEAHTASRLLIEQHMTGRWQGEIRVETQHGQAAILLDWLVRLVEHTQARLNLRPFAVERTSTACTAPDAAPLAFRQEKPTIKE